MADKQKMQFITITETTYFENLNTFSILNNGDSCEIEINEIDNTGVISLGQGQTLSLSANTGFVLPNLVISVENLRILNASVITS